MNAKLIGYACILAGSVINGTTDVVREAKKQKAEKEKEKETNNKNKEG